MLFAESAHAKDGRTDCTEDNRSHRYVIGVLGRLLRRLGRGGGGWLHRGRCVGADAVGVLMCLVSMVKMVLARTAVIMSALAVGSPGVRKRWSGEQTQNDKERRKTTKITHGNQLLCFPSYHQSKENKKRTGGNLA